jgi:hypothetical protein
MAENPNPAGRSGSGLVTANHQVVNGAFRHASQIRRPFDKKSPRTGRQASISTRRTVLAEAALTMIKIGLTATISFAPASQ